MLARRVAVIGRGGAGRQLQPPSAPLRRSYSVTAATRLEYEDPFESLSTPHLLQSTVRASTAATAATAATATTAALALALAAAPARRGRARREAPEARLQPKVSTT